MRHEDRLDPDPPAGREDPVQGLEVRRPVLPADGLDHLHGDDGVVGPGDLAVVAEVDLDPVGEPRVGDPLAGELLLLGESVIDRTVAPRAAARTANSPQPVPISSTRVPSSTRAASRRRSILRSWASWRSEEVSKSAAE